MKPGNLTVREENGVISASIGVSKQLMTPYLGGLT
jgi:hypothetical protein